MLKIDKGIVLSEFSLASFEDDAIASDAAPAIVANISVWSHFVVVDRVSCALRSSHFNLIFLFCTSVKECPHETLFGKSKFWLDKRR